MTALAGLWAFDAAAEPRRACDSMLAAQAIYGPEPPTCWSAAGLALGTRAFRLLPEDAFDSGPLTADDSGNCLVADVRLDNRAELCRALAISDPDARVSSDSAILFRALEHWGEAALPRLVGDFAFVFWEARRRRLMLARDYLGHRPLHYHVGRGFFACASMPKGLHALPEIARAPDLSTTAEFLALLPERPGSSFFEGIRTVEPGHFACVTPDGVRCQRYWNPDLSPLRLRRSEDYEEALREALDRAVAAMLRGSTARVGAHLSGGLDSSAIAATAARIMSPADGKVVAFTSAPRAAYDGGHPLGAIIDEAPLAAEVAAQFANMEHVVLRGPWPTPVQSNDRNFYYYERPLLNLCNFAWSDAINDAAKARGLKVMLMGRRGNTGMSFTGMTRLPQLLRRGKLVRLAALSRALARNGTRWGTIAAQSVGPFLPLPVWRTVQRLRRRATGLHDYSAIHPDAVSDFDIEARGRSLGLDVSYRRRADGIEHRLWVLGSVDLGNYKKGTLACWGIDSRDPAADRRLIELCLRIPEDQYVLGGVQRSLARRAFSDRLPPAVLRQSSKGYQAADWHEGLTAAREAVKEELDRLSGVACAQMLDLEGMKRLVDDWPTDSWHKNAVVQAYRLRLLRGISVGHFLRKASGSNR